MHGGDPMKRSVNNQVTTQAALAVLMSNTFFQPLFTWRIIIGPITPRLSIFASVVDNIFKNWIGVCFTQMTIFKVSNSFYEDLSADLMLIKSFRHYCSLTFLVCLEWMMYSLEDLY